MILLKGCGGEFVSEGGFIERGVGIVGYGVSLAIVKGVEATKLLNTTEQGVILAKGVGGEGFGVSLALAGGLETAKLLNTGEFEFGVSLARGIGYATEINLLS